MNENEIKKEIRIAATQQRNDIMNYNKELYGEKVKKGVFVVEKTKKEFT